MIGRIHILRTITILAVTLYKDLAPQLQFYRIRYSGGNTIILNCHNWNDMQAVNIKSPVLIIVGGYGIIKRDICGNIAIYEKVKTDTKTYTFYENEKEFIFLRKIHIHNILDQLNKLKVRYLPIRLSDIQHLNDTTALEYALDFFHKETGIIKLFSFTPQADIIAGVIFKQLKLSVLCITFILLLVNTFIRNNLEQKYNLQRGVLNQLQQTQIQHEKIQNNKKSSVDKFIIESNIRYAVIADKIASILPDEISLTRLHIAPLDRGVKKEKIPQYLLNTIFIEGNPKDNDIIGIFLDNLKRLKFIKEVHLDNVKHDNRDNRLSFKIRLAIK